MKNRKLLIPVRYTTRKFYLQPPPPGRNNWHVRFVPPSVDGVPREIFRSTGTKEIATAKRIGAQIIEAHGKSSANYTPGFAHLLDSVCPSYPRINRHRCARFVFDLNLLKGKRHIFEPATVIAKVLPEV